MWPESDDQRCDNAGCPLQHQKLQDLAGISSKRDFCAIRDSFLRRRCWSLEKSLEKKANPGLQPLLLCTSVSQLTCLPCAAGLQVI